MEPDGLDLLEDYFTLQLSGLQVPRGLFQSTTFISRKDDSNDGTVCLPDQEFSGGVQKRLFLQ